MQRERETGRARGKRSLEKIIVNILTTKDREKRIVHWGGREEVNKVERGKLEEEDERIFFLLEEIIRKIKMDTGTTKKCWSS